MTTEPRRWRAHGPDATDEIDELLRSAAGTRAMTAAERSAGAQRVAAIARGPAAAAGARVALRGLAIGGAAIAVAVAVLVLVHAGRTAHRAVPGLAHRGAVTSAVVPSREPTPSVAPPPAPLAPAPRPPPSLAPRSTPRTGPPRAPMAPAAASGGDLEREDALLLDAHRLVATDPAGALASIAVYDAQCPRRQLAQERDAIEIAALVALGRTDAARGRAAQALAHDHGSAYRLRIERLLAAAPARDP